MIGAPTTSYRHADRGSKKAPIYRRFRVELDGIEPTNRPQESRFHPVPDGSIPRYER